MNTVSSRHVPHEGPEDSPLIFIGEAPGSTENEIQKIFCGRAGDLLLQALQNFGIERDAVRLANVLNYQPAGNKMENAYGSYQLQESQEYLRSYLKTAKHKVIVAMGSAALEFFAGLNSIEKHRGSVYTYGKYYVVPTWHPSSVVYNGGNAPAFLHDISKALRIAEAGTFKEHEFNAIVDPDPSRLESITDKILSAPKITVDIETKKYTSYIRCIGFAWSATESVCIFNDARYEDGFSPVGSIFRHDVSNVLSSSVPKTFHNGMFDTIMLGYNDLAVSNWTYDTMVAQHVLQPELPIGLDYCTSMYTDLNYYKDDGKESGDKLDRNKLGLYNCKDVIATWLTEEAQEKEFDDVSRSYFQYKMKQIPLATHFSQTGMLVDPERRDLLAGLVEEKRIQDYQMFTGIHQLLGVEPFKASQHKKVQDFLYKTLELPVKRNKEGGITSDETAVVALMGTVQKKIEELKTPAAKQKWEIRMAVLKLLLNIRGYEKLSSSYININLSKDGRARSWYKFWGTETGRWSAGMWHDNTGLNGQTIPREGL